MVGTPPVICTRSRSMIAIASSGSHLRMKTRVWPATIVPISIALRAVQWKSGMTIRAVLGCGSGGASPRRSAARAFE